MRKKLTLPVVQTGPSPADGPDAEARPPGASVGGAPSSDRAFGAGPDPALLEAGWEHRFVATGERVVEMVALYRELGFEVLEEPVPAAELDLGCAACFSGQLEYRSIYTRRPDGTPDTAPRDGAPQDTTAEEALRAMSENHPTQVLRDEHQWILQVADALERLLKVDPEPLDYDAIEKCIRFIRLFADACHHGKEEDLLFPELEEQGMSREVGPIAVMLYEHRIGRENVAAMRAALPGAREGKDDDRARLIHAGRAYVDLIRGHIGKEDNVLFNMADQMVTGERRSLLCAAYDGTCDHSFEGCTKAQLEELGREILGIE